MKTESFSSSERAALAPFFTNLEGPVFALRNLPEVVKGALFARYSRSAKSLRRLFLDEFLDDIDAGGELGAVGVDRADRLYEKVFDEYGDDSVAQLGAAHVACEDASNLLTKVLEWGRMMSYLEQSTRYIPYTDRRGGRWRYHLPAEIGDPTLFAQYTATLDHAFETYSRWLEPLEFLFQKKFPRDPSDPEAVYRRTIRAKALDTLRGLLPAATQSSVGIFGSAQGFEALLLRMQVHPLQEARDTAARMLVELRKVIPSFLKRVDRADRGGAWSQYLATTREATARISDRLTDGIEGEAVPEVTLTDFDPDGEAKVVAAALYASSRLPDSRLLALARNLPDEDRRAVLRAYVGERRNRRHRPGRAFERTGYRFDVLADYGAFRDLQRHRLLTLEWQRLGPDHGYVMDPAVEEVGAAADWQEVMDRSRSLHDALVRANLPEVAPYAVSMAHRVRFYLDMNAREAMHVIELRTSPQGHPAYRRVCQAMHRLIAEEAGHRSIAEAMTFANHDDVDLERLEAERGAEQKRRQRD